MLASLARMFGVTSAVARDTSPELKAIVDLNSQFRADAQAVCSYMRNERRARELALLTGALHSAGEG